MTAYYNEFDQKAAAWLRELIAEGHIAPGIVDERSIEDVYPSDLQGFTQCHFFAGIGVWSYALRRAGWSDDRPVWTGSCPCQPFSAAGNGAAFADERHLWPAFHHLIRERRPAAILGEQVASKDADAWVDLVHTDLEAMGYAFGAVAFPSAGVGAPHIRDRTYWMALANGHGRQEQRRFARGQQARRHGSASISTIGLLGDTNRQGLSLCQQPAVAPARGRQEGRAAEQSGGAPGRLADGQGNGRGEERADAGRLAAGDRAQGVGAGLGDGCCDGGMADAELQQRPDGQSAVGNVDAAGGREQGAATTAGLCNDSRPGPTNGFWGTADWLLCRDGKWRAVEPGAFPLAHGAAARVGRLRGYGNAINAVAAQVFIEAVMESV